MVGPSGMSMKPVVMMSSAKGRRNLHRGTTSDSLAIR